MAQCRNLLSGSYETEDSRPALALGAAFVWLAVRLRRDATPRRAALLFHYSLLYLALLFVAMALDLVIA